MKRTIRVAFAAGIAAGLLAGCNLNKASIEDRIDMFMDDVHAGAYSSLYTHMHDDLGAIKDVMRISTYWTATSFLTTSTLSGMSYGATTASGQFRDGLDVLAGITFQMREDDPDDWYILSITIGVPYNENIP